MPITNDDLMYWVSFDFPSVELTVVEKEHLTYDLISFDDIFPF